MHDNVSVPPVKRGPTSRESPQPAKPGIQPLDAKDAAVSVVVKVNAKIDAGNPAQHKRGTGNKSQSRPWSGDVRFLRIQVKPEGTAVSEQRYEVKYYSMNVSRMAEDCAVLIFRS